MAPYEVPSFRFGTSCALGGRAHAISASASMGHHTRVTTGLACSSACCNSSRSSLGVPHARRAASSLLRAARQSATSTRCRSASSASSAYRVPARTAAPGYRDSSGMVLSCHGRQNTPGAWRARGIKCVSRVLAVDVGTSPRGPALGSFHRVLRGSTMSPLTTLSGIGDLCWSSRKRSHRRVSCRCSRSSSLGASRVASLRCRKPRAAHARHRDIKCTRRHRQPAARAPKEMSSSSKSRALG